jgi:hypothetical protein
MIVSRPYDMRSSIVRPRQACQAPCRAKPTYSSDLYLKRSLPAEDLLLSLQLLSLNALRVAAITPACVSFPLCVGYCSLLAIREAPLCDKYDDRVTNSWISDQLILGSINIVFPNHIFEEMICTQTYMYDQFGP